MGLRYNHRDARSIDRKKTSFHMVAVAQLVERQIVALNVTCSIHAGYPSWKVDVHGWRAGLKIQRLWFDSRTFHQYLLLDFNQYLSVTQRIE